MNKSTRIVKKLLALFLVVLMSIESFAAVVGDNDGAAFITKAEFDSKVNEFNTEINRYETSIDAKLQGAISSYIEGVRIQYKPTVLYNSSKVNLGCNPFFLNALPGSSTSSIGTNVIGNASKYYSLKYKVPGALVYNEIRLKIRSNYDSNWWVYLQPVNADGSLIGDTNVQVSFKKTNNSYGYQFQTYSGYYYQIRFKIPMIYGNNLEIGYSKAGTYGWDYNSCGTWTKWQTLTPKPDGGIQPIVLIDYTTYSNWENTMAIVFKSSGLARNEAGGLEAETLGQWDGDGTGQYTGGSDFMATGNIKYSGLSNNWNWAEPTDGGFESSAHNSISKSISKSGSGQVYVYDSLPSGGRELTTYYSSFYPMMILDLNYKTFKEYPNAPVEFKGDELKDDNVSTYTPNNAASYGLASYGTRYTAYGTQNKVGYLQQVIALNKTKGPGPDLRTAQFGNNTTATLYAVVPEPPLVKSSVNLATNYTNLAAGSFAAEGVNHTISGVTNNVYEIQVKPTQYVLNTFENSIYSAIAGESVKMGYGIPIMMTNADDSARYTITIPVKQTVAPAGTAAASGTVTARLSRNHFVNGGFASSTDKVWEGTISCNSSGVGTATFTIDGLPKGQLLWLNLFGTTANRKVELTGFNVTMS